jgi:hypothetical protein
VGVYVVVVVVVVIAAPSREEAPHFIVAGVGPRRSCRPATRTREKGGKAHLTCSKAQGRRGSKVSSQAKREIRKWWWGVCVGGGGGV